MIHYQEATKCEPHFKRMQPHGVRPGVALDNKAAMYSMLKPDYSYEPCAHDWTSTDSTDRYKVCRNCGLGWDNHKDQEAPVVKEACCTCANTHKKALARVKKINKGLHPGQRLPEPPAPEPVNMHALYTCDRCGQVMCIMHTPADEDYPFMHCRSCQLEYTKERNQKYKTRRAELDAGAATIRANLEANPPVNVTVLTEAVRAKAGRRSKAVTQ